MTPEDVVRAIYDAWREGRSARQWIAEDVEYVNPADAVETGVKRGRKYFAGIRDVYDDVVITPERIEATGEEDVLVIARLTGRAGGSGVEIDTHQGYVWTVRDDLAVRFRWFRRPDEALAASELALNMRRVLPAPRAVVFTALTEPDELAEWWGPQGFTAPNIELDLRVGGGYRIAMQPPDGDLFYLSGEFTEVDPPAQLAYTFRWEDPDPDDQETVVTLSFTDSGESTDLVVVQRAFATEARRALHEQGWTDSLDRLEAVLPCSG